MKFLTKILIPTALLLLATIVFIALDKSKPKAEQKDSTEQSWIVNATSIKPERSAPFLTLYGQLSTNAEIALTANIEANVLKRHVNIGEKVTKNQSLLSLDKFIQQQTVALQQAEVSDAEAALSDEKMNNDNNVQILDKEKSLLAIANAAVNRTTTLEKSNMASSSQLEDAKRDALTREIAITQRQSSIASHPIRVKQLKARIVQAKTRLALAKRDLQDTEIRSPVNGIVKQISIDGGELARKGSALLTLIDTDQLELKVLIPEKHLSSLPQDLQLHNNPAYTLIGEEKIPVQLVRMANFVEKGQAGVFAFLNTPPHPGFVLGGTYEVKLALQPTEAAILLPHEALYGTDTIYTIVDERLNEVPVNWLGETIDAEGNQKILVKSAALAAGDVVLISKFANAMNGLKVSVAQ